MSEDFSALQATMKKAKEAAHKLAGSSGQERDNFLKSLTTLLSQSSVAILEANQKDIEKAKANKANPALCDRLLLNEKRLSQLEVGLSDCIALPDPLGRIEDLTTRPDGLRVGRQRIPLGLIGFICEARPGAVVEATAMAVKSGNGLLAKPGRESLESSRVFNRLITEALDLSRLPLEAVSILPDLSYDQLKFMIAQDQLLDLVIPRGGESLIRFVADNSKVPVLKHYKGVNHLYVDKAADIDMAIDLTINGKCNRPSTCNALECLLVHKSRAADFLPMVVRALLEHKVRILACPRTKEALGPDSGAGLEEALEEHFGREFLELTLAIKIVDSLEEALDHIRRYGSNHTESICTTDLERSTLFLNRVDASCVMVNASTRLNDGGCLGLGAEIGISTSKIHAYGPMGLKELTTTKFVVIGQGHLRS
ncbi:MAG: glutamate-5-semialdehyde dehydrogenase [Deltaproteobacteria bacterium]|jgi:glutamate-5-semialdehyde dehydrogenase|nr:glutamate-5-semialdehyde dehydrogenase [Deltaproteobacteria bacterium]